MRAKPGQSLFQVCELVSGPDGWEASNPCRFFVMETIFTSDGLRTRICEGRYKTRDEAEASILLRRNRMG